MLNALEIPTSTPPEKFRPLRDLYAEEKVAEAMGNGRINVEQEAILANVRSAIRRGHPQWRPGPVRKGPNDRICLVGGGPSLEATFPELQRLVFEGATLVTVNGAHDYCVARGLRPQTQFVMDARPSNRRFVATAVPRCNYMLASQCAPELFDAVDGRENVWIFHAITSGDGPVSKMLDTYYGGKWIGVGGGTTVASRAITLLRASGYLRYDLFGVDCCWLEDQHHAYAQQENARDRAIRAIAGAKGRPETLREFRVAPWMLKQVEDLLTIMQVNGRFYQITAHGDGLLAHLLRVLGSDSELSIESQER